MQVWSEVGTQKVNVAKVELEMASISFVFFTFSHVVPNVIHYCPIV
jgi:hypothetical protein